MAGRLKRADLKIFSRPDLLSILRTNYKTDAPADATREALIDLIIGKQSDSGQRSNQEIARGIGL